MISGLDRFLMKVWKQKYGRYYFANILSPSQVKFYVKLLEDMKK